MQTSYTQAPVKATAGLPGDNSEQDFIESFAAAETIPFGVAVELDANGNIVLPKSASLGKVVGVSLRSATLVQDIGGSEGQWKTGDLVPVLRRGKVWAKFNGGTQARYTGVTVRHASDNTNNEVQYRGFVSASAPSATAGQEKTAKPGIIFLELVTVSGLALVEVNHPENVGS